MSKVYFVPDSHSYICKDGSDIKLTSVSKIIELVKQPFDSDFWADKKAKARGITKEEVLKEWNEKKQRALTKGTNYHNSFEEKLLKDKNVHPSMFIDGYKHSHNLLELKPGVHPELILYNLKGGIVGTADIVEIFEDRTFNILDHKTNAELNFESFKKFDPIYKERRPVMMQPPMSHIQDCSGMHYTIQLSLYAWMLEQFGFKCNSLTINHVIFDENEEPCNIIQYPIQYIKKDVINLVNWFQKNRR